MLVTGFPRSGTTLMYCMLRYAVDGWRFRSWETWVPRAGFILKSVSAPIEAPWNLLDGALVMLRDPREMLCSVYDFGPYKGQPFMSAHSTLDNASQGLCERWEALRSIVDAYYVRYEDLVTEPRRIQAELADRYGLKYREGRWFDEFHREPHGEHWEGAMNGRRPLARSRHLDPQRLADQFGKFPELYRVCEEMGYPEPAKEAA